MISALNIVCKGLYAFGDMSSWAMAQHKYLIYQRMVIFTTDAFIALLLILLLSRRG